MHRRLFRLTAGDVVLVAAVLAGAAFALRASFAKPTGERTVYVYQDNRLVLTQPLGRDTTVWVAGLKAQGARPKAQGQDRGGAATLEVQIPHSVRVEVKAGRVRVAESDCPNQVCVRRGWISRPGQTIVCVPNRVLVEIKGADTGGIDAETH